MAHQLVLRRFEVFLVFHFDANRGIEPRAERLREGRQRHDSVRIEAEQPEECAHLRPDTDDAEWIAVDEHGFPNRWFAREQRLGDIVAEDDDVRAAARFCFGEESSLTERADRGNEKFVGRALREDRIDLVVAVLDVANCVQRRDGRDQLRIRRRSDDALQVVGVMHLHRAAVAVVPPVIDVVPRPFLDVEDVVADDREAALESDFNAGDRRSHQRDRDDADDHTESGQDRAHFVRPDHLKRDAECLGQLVNHSKLRISNFK